MAGQGELTRENAATLHLHLWLSAFHRTLSGAVAARGKAVRQSAHAPAPQGAISPHHADALLAAIESRVRNGPVIMPPVALTRTEERTEAELLQTAPTKPPLIRLAESAGFTAFDRTALLAAIAPEVTPEIRPLYGYILDDLSRADASVELVLALTARGPSDLGSRLRRLGPGGPLRHLGLLVSDDLLATSMATRLSPVAGLVEWLLGATAAPPVPLRDPRMILPGTVSQAISMAALDPAIRCLATAANGSAGLWGSDPNRHDDAVAVLARDIGRPVLRARGGDTFEPWWMQVRVDAAVAAGADAILWIDARTLPSGGDLERAGAALAMLPQRILLTGRMPWRPTDFIGGRPYADILLAREADTPAGDWALPADALPAPAGAEIDARFRLGFRARRAAAQVALSDVRNHANGHVPDMSEALAKAAKMLATPGHLPSVQVIEPRRTLDDLILPDGQHAQIAEMGGLIAHTATVDGAWGFGRLTGSSGAIKALFTGDPGTGKTLAAEVAANAAGVSLMKVDLSQVVSKWVGETEKNLEAVFDHAEQSRAALFFDEADALFGKRGEVRHGTDRYANLEVSYLLQRLESYSGGLLILASNLRDEIDPAFSRRFQISMHFPRPGPDERLRLWKMAFASAPIAPGLDLAEAAGHDLTGGGIVTAARMAALLAAVDGAKWINQTHLESATERQFRKEARLMSARNPDGLSVARGRA